jgi:hypothetical protein
MVKVLIHILMPFNFFSTPVLIRHLWQLKRLCLPALMCNSAVLLCLLSYCPRSQGKKLGFANVVISCLRRNHIRLNTGLYCLQIICLWMSHLKFFERLRVLPKLFYISGQIYLPEVAFKLDRLPPN